MPRSVAKFDWLAAAIILVPVWILLAGSNNIRHLWEAVLCLLGQGVTGYRLKIVFLLNVQSEESLSKRNNNLYKKAIIVWFYVHQIMICLGH